MAERPTAFELVEAAREFMESEILPTLEDHRLRFRTLVALNALGIAERELRLDRPASDERELRKLARRIRAGDVPPGTLAALKEHVRARLEIASPRYLERYR